MDPRKTFQGAHRRAAHGGMREVELDHTRCRVDSGPLWTAKCLEVAIVLKCAGSSLMTPAAWRISA
jgi:hypothetical protein